jgi:hypothetical protein
MSDDLVYRLRKRAEIRRQISTRKSVQEGKPDRIADLLEEAAEALAESANSTTDFVEPKTPVQQKQEPFIVDRGCWERGCMAYDWRDGDGVNISAGRVDEMAKHKHEEKNT